MTDSLSQHLREEEILPYLEGRLEAAARESMESHLAGCDACRLQLEELRSVSNVLGDWQVGAPSSSFDAIVRQKLESQQATVFDLLLSWRPVVAGGFALAALVVGVLLLQQPVDPSFEALLNGESIPANWDEVVAQEADLVVLENPQMVENFELLRQFDALFEPVADTGNQL